MRAKRLLIIEDDPALLRGLKDNFRAEGYQFRTASDGQKGLADMLRDPPDLVLLDLTLPKVSGYEICRAARSRQLSTPILMLTARTDEDDIVRGFELGADDYVTKPFSIRELLARAKVCSHRRLVTSAPSASAAPAAAPTPAGGCASGSRQ
jgi:DNA-binding response OmpR family regulator